jgi:hypothetical protein
MGFCLFFILFEILGFVFLMTLINHRSTLQHWVVRCHMGGGVSTNVRWLAETASKLDYNI